MKRTQWLLVALTLCFSTGLRAQAASGEEAAVRGVVESYLHGLKFNDVPSLKDQTIRVNIANANSLKARRDVFVRFMKAFGETIDWMYSSDPKALEAYVAFRKTTPRNATRLRDEFFAKSALDPNTVKGMDALMTEAVNLKFMPRVLTTTELAEFVQVPLR